MPTSGQVNSITSAQPEALGRRGLERWLPLARAAWLLIAALSLALWLLGGYTNAAQPLPVCAQVLCDPFSLSAEDMQVVQVLGLPQGLILGFWLATNILLGLSFFVVAGVLFWRRRDAWIGLLASSTLIFLGSLLFTENDDALWRAYAASRLPLAILYPLGWLALMLLLFNFPDGRFVPRRRSARVAVLILMFLSIPFTVRAAREATLGTLLAIVPLTLGLATQVYRYFRVSGPVQRQQTKWVVLGLVAALCVMLLWSFTGNAFPPAPSSPQRIYFLLILRVVIVVLISSLPLAIALSILRYRLWDIDLLIRRTLVYGVLTGALAAVYFGTVLLLQGLFRALSGGAAQSQLAVVGSTLAIAALFNPLRSRVQGLIDRRFYRRKYNATQTLAAFAAAARDETDLERLSAQLVDVVDDTVQPEHVSLWLKEATGRE